MLQHNGLNVLIKRGEKVKRIRAFIAIGLISSLIISGCGNGSGGQTVLNAADSTVEDGGNVTDSLTGGTAGSEEENENTENVESDTKSEQESDDGSKSTDNKTESTSEAELTSEDATKKDSGNKNNLSGQSDLISGFRIIHCDNNYYGENYQGLIIGHDFEKVGLSEDTKKAYPELEKALLTVNDLIATDEANNYYVAYQQVVKKGTSESYDHPVQDMTWDVYVRRADKDVVSILVKITTASYEDYNHVRYMGYNIDTKTGEIMSLSDIIEDEDSLYDVLIQKFMDVMKADYEGFFAGGNEMSESELMKNLQNYFYEDQISWTLDPQGVSFWLNSMNLSPSPMDCKIMFCEDEKGMIFNKSVRENIPDTWVTQLNPNTYESIDADDDGKADTVYVMETYETVESEVNENTSGILVDFNGKEYSFNNYAEDYDFLFSVVHQDGKSMLFVQYKEYEADIQELYKLDEKEVARTDMVCGWVCGGTEETFYDFEEYSYVSPIMTDLVHFQMAVTTWLLSTADAVFDYTITNEGKFKRLSDRGMLFVDSRYELTLKVPLKGVPIVDSRTEEVSEDTCNLDAGDKLKLMYTDVDNYVDCLTGDNKLVRIYVYNDYDLGSCVETDGQKKTVYEVFDDMFYAG